MYGLVTTEIGLANLVHKSLSCSGFVVLFFLNGETSHCYCSKIIFGSQQNKILQIRKKKSKTKNENDMYDFPVHDCTQEQNSTPYFLPSFDDANGRLYQERW